MKFKWDKKYLYWGITAFLVIAGAAVFAAAIMNFDSIYKFISAILSILSPVLIAFIFAYLLDPVCGFFETVCFRRLFFKIDHWLQKKSIEKNKEYHHKNNCHKIRRMSRGVAVFATMLTAVLLVVALLSAVLPQLVVTIQTLVSNIPHYITEGNKLASKLLEDYPDIQKSVTEFISNISTNLMDWLSNILLPQMNNIVDSVSSGVKDILSSFLNIIIGFIISIYFLYNKELFSAQLKKAMYGFLDEKNANWILRNLRKIHKVFGGFISGKIIDSFIIGIIFFIILAVFDFPYFVLISIVLGVTNVIPYFGPIIGAIPCALLVLLENPLYCVYFVIIVLVVQQVDGNIIGPKILGGSIGLSSFWVIFALLLGQGIFGFWGLVIGVPLFAVIYSFMRDKVKKKLDAKNLPSDTNVYKKVGYINSETHEIVSIHRIKADERLEQEEEQRRKQEKAAKKSLLKHEISFFSKKGGKNKNNKDNKSDK